MMQDLRPKHVLLLLSAAGLAGWFGRLPPEPVPAMVQPRSDRWELAALPSQNDATSMVVQVASSSVWGPEIKAASEAPIENNRWRLAGVYGSGKHGGALVLFEDVQKAPQRLKVGEKLPSGHVIEAVDGNQVCIRVGRKLYRFGVELRD
ncbi:hypothetical protein [Roseateles violae]|uniref:Type II secretion system protein GspC N-terminal domain-containing protein n=1 Tax=Roseateles violae TaxID=3058042 RepID=A0ABT8DRL7_9BURK|nr:hypothetical protein [Pelomonas sp. PFR6]MDN3920966.1 hypothetical protein [Pelomonas sp. PFR6]